MPPIMLLLFVPSLLGLWLAVKIVAAAVRVSLAFVPLFFVVMAVLMALDILEGRFGQ